MTPSPSDLALVLPAGLFGALLGTAGWLLLRRQAKAHARIKFLEQELIGTRDALSGLSHFKTALDRTLDALYIFRASDTQLLYVNQGCAEQLDYNVNELVGKPLSIIKADGAMEAFQRTGEPLTRGPRRAVTYEAVHRRKNGSTFPVEIFLQYQDADPDTGQEARFIAIARDISARRSAEAALRNATAQIEAILANIPVGISIISPDRRIVRVNEAFCRIYGGGEADLLGRSTAEFYSDPRDFEQMSQAALPLVRQGQTFAADFHMRRMSDNRDLWCHLTGRLIDPAEPSLGFIWVHDDITERRRTEQALRDRQELFEQMFRSNTAVKMLVDPVDGRIVDVNPAAARFYGHSLEQLRAMLITDINALPPEEVLSALAEVTAGTRQHFFFRHRLASGELRDVEVHSSPITVQGRAFILSIIQDITERLESEVALEHRTAELQRSNADLEAFAYVASHDLRQPLRMVNSYLALLERRLGDKLDEEGHEFLNFARNGAERMDRLILDLLDYARVGRRERPMSAVPLGAVLEDALPAMQGIIEDLGAALVWPEHLPTVVGDQQELVRLFQNLIGNALKYRDPGRVPKIEISCSRQGDDWQLAVKDNGIGIGEDYYDRIFGLFQRLHGQGEYDGTGIGLAVCKKIVEHHGGRIWVESTPGVGSTFLFTLPAGGPRAG